MRGGLTEAPTGLWVLLVPLVLLWVLLTLVEKRYRIGEIKETE